MILPRPLLALLAALFLLLGSAGQSRAEDSPDDLARQIKAAYLVKFANYIEWPSKTFEGPTSPIVIGVIGADRLADELERITLDRQIGRRPIAINRLSTQDKAPAVHILYIGSRAGPGIREWFQAASSQPMLIVSDASHELSSASAIKFVLDNNRLRFDVSVPVAERSGIKITAPLLTVARRLEQ
jgi:hypothetical protein